MLSFLSLFFTIAGFIIGLGAVTVIDWHGFLAQKNVYWTKATISAHKITKPLIWLGTVFLLIGKVLDFLNQGLTDLVFINFVLVLMLIANGCFLTFVVSPFLLKLEKKGVTKPLPQSLQTKIKISFLFSFFGWWGMVLLFVYSLL